MASAVLPIVSGLTGLFGNLFGPKASSTSNVDNTTTNSSNQTSTTAANLTPLQQQLIQLFTGAAGQTLDSANHMNPYISSNLASIGQQGDLNRRVISNSLAARGLSYSPAAGTALTQNLLNTSGQQGQFMQQLPLLQNQLRSQGFQQLLQAFGVLPTSMTSSMSGDSTVHNFGTVANSQSQQGNPAAGALSGFGAALPLAYPNLFGGYQQKPQSNTTVLPGYGQPIWGNPNQTTLR